MTDLACVGSNHVPGHTPDCPRFAAPEGRPLGLRFLGGGMLAGHPDFGTARDPGFVPALAAELEAAMPDVDEILAGTVSPPTGAAIETAWAPAVAAVTSVTPGLRVTLVVEVTRAGRRRCPICRKTRVLIRQTAFAADQPVGYGEARCYPCAGLRNGR